MTNNSRVSVGVISLLMVAGCGEGPGVDAESAALSTSNGRMQNGRMQNGRMQNGSLQNGAELSLAGVDLTTMKQLLALPPAGQDPDLSAANLVAVPNVRLTQSMLTDGIKSGLAFAGHVVDATFNDGAGHTAAGQIYIERVAATADPEIFHYTLKAFHPFMPAAGQACDGPCPTISEYACGVTQSNPVLQKDARAIVIGTPIWTITTPVTATAVGGQWNYDEGVPGGGAKIIEQGNASYDTHVTFACSDGTIGKCVETMHYKPWAPAASECRKVCGTAFPRLGCQLQCAQPTQELIHEACVRMVRADYCGDGYSHTINGIDIDVWDQSNINTETPYSTNLAVGVPFGHEAEWTPNGARCLPTVMMARLSSDVDGEPLLEYLNHHCSNKWGGQPYQGSYFGWADNDCFGDGPVSQHSTWSYANVPAGFDNHNRVLIRQKSQCVDDKVAGMDATHPNPMKTFPPCLHDAT